MYVQSQGLSRAWGKKLLHILSVAASPWRQQWKQLIVGVSGDFGGPGSAPVNMHVL